MTAEVFDGNELAAEKELALKKRVAKLGKALKLVSIVVGDDPASHLYVRLKGEAAQRIGISFEKFEIRSTKFEIILKIIIFKCSKRF